MELWTATFWLIVALVLIGGEVILPGAFLLWFGAGAAVLAVLLSMIVLSVPVQLTVFAVISVLGVLVLRPVLHNRLGSRNDDINGNRADLYVGQVFTVSSDISGGMGKVRVGDTEWLLRSRAELKAGDKTRITATDGAVLIGEAA